MGIPDPTASAAPETRGLLIESSRESLATTWPPSRAGGLSAVGEPGLGGRGLRHSLVSSLLP